MFFVLSKIFWTLAMPLNALCLLALAGFGLRFWKKEAGNKILAFSLALIVFLGLFPVGPFALTLLENRYAVPVELPEKVDGIIVLGGMFDTHLTRSRGQVAANDSIERMACFTNLAKKYPGARKVFTGGSGDIEHPDAREAESALDYIEHSTLRTSDVIFEKDSRNTYENAVFSRELVNPAEGQTWILVTSAFHMPRSVGIFEKQEWPVIPYPCDYRTDGTYDFIFSPPNAAGNFAMLNIVVKEMIGAVAYYLTGKSAFILPPRPVKS